MDRGTSAIHAGTFYPTNFTVMPATRSIDRNPLLLLRLFVRIGHPDKRCRWLTGVKVEESTICVLDTPTCRLILTALYFHVGFQRYAVIVLTAVLQ
jgi:hypothetical protein